MFKSMLAISTLFTIFISSLSAEHVVWSGAVSSNGNPTQAVSLNLDKKYQIVAQGTINLGKWVEGGHRLEDDPCYEFNAPSGPEKLKSLRNSNDIPLNDKTFNPEHLYKSEPFVAKQSKIHFWVYDLDYSDNTGAFDVKIVELD
ncbi:MAG: hypothetical protein BGO14_04645 [Chlamydiales bacterium 38-26]|nr:hypothetical protein [Chlamydiales bacterium]OJV07780.1 MAG: hypothetical protein BGO14_04645 [Chlamydiales bacterium 38-26]